MLRRCIGILACASVLAHGGTADAKGCPGAVVTSTATDPFEKCICDIIGDALAIPPKPTCLKGLSWISDMQALKRAGCISVATVQQLFDYYVSAGHTPHFAWKLAGITGGEYLPEKNCVVFNRDFDWLMSTVGNWRKKTVAQHESAHVALHGAKVWVHKADDIANKSCMRAYREVQAQTAAVMMLVAAVESGQHTGSELAKIKNMITLALDRLKAYLGDLCDALEKATGAWKTLAQKCKTFAISARNKAETHAN